MSQDNFIPEPASTNGNSVEFLDRVSGDKGVTNTDKNLSEKGPGSSPRRLDHFSDGDERLPFEPLQERPDVEKGKK